MAELRNRVIGGFRIIDDLKLGSGSEGTVYKAVCETARFDGCPVGTVVALKTMMASDDDPRTYARLEKRTSELVRLNHPNVVRYFGCFSEQLELAEWHVIVEEFLEGETLKECLLMHPAGLDVDEALRVVKSVIAGLLTAASKGIYHRDVKPANIFMCADGSVKLIDFEVARHEGGSSSTGGAMVGTFDYMAPDFTDPSFRGDEMSDIFSAGVVMHEAITGRTPYQKLSGDQAQANFAFLARWVRNEKGEFTANPISISSKVRRLLSHGDEVLAAALSPDRSKRLAHFSDFVLALGKIHFRELRNASGGSAYQLLQIVGHGGFGEVFKARDRRSGRPVAIKHLLKQGYAERFRREAKVMAKLVDPCFVRFIEFFETADTGAFIVMDFLDGMPGNSLRDAIRRAKGVGLDRKDVLRAFVRYAHALALMHTGRKDRDPIYHRDIKPSNLYFPERRIENSALMDFGIAKDMGGTKTFAGTVPGTLDYMPPEIVLLESRGDASVDIYALGLCLYEALSGKMAYPRVRDDKAADIAFMSRATKKLKPNFGDPSVSAHPEILSLLTAMTEPDVKKRLGNAREVELRLAKLAGVEPFPMEQDVVCAAQKAAERAEPQNGEETTVATRILPRDGDTSGTTEMLPDAFQEAFQRERMRLLVRRVLRWGLLFGLLATVIIAYFAVPPIRNGIGGIIAFVRENRAEHEYRANLELAERSANDVIGKYGDMFLASTGSASRQAWIDKWSVILRPDDLLRLRGEIDKARDAREQRDKAKRKAHDESQAEREYREKLDQAERAARDVSGKYDDVFPMGVGDSSRAEWNRQWTDRLHAGDLKRLKQAIDRTRDGRILRDEAKAYTNDLMTARKESASVKGTFISDDPLPEADDAFGAWKRKWQGRILESDWAPLQMEVAKAREERVEREKEKEAAARIAKEKERQANVAAIRANMESLLRAEPLAGRRQRLDECDRLLAAKETLDLLDEAERVRCRNRITAERLRVVGTVKNDSSLDFRVGDGDGAQYVPAKSAVTLDFPRGLQLGASLVTAGYEPIRVTREEIDGVTFTIAADRPVPETVAVTLPRLSEDVSCLVDGRAFASGQKLRPGKHGYVYRRDDYLDQSGSITVEIGVPRVMPAPVEWQATPGLVKLNEIEVAFNRLKATDYNAAKTTELELELERIGTLLGEVNVVSPKNHMRKDELKDRLEKSKAELKARLEKRKTEEAQRLKFENLLRRAREYYSFGSWRDALSTYADLREAGYALAGEDRKICAEARDNGTNEINGRIKKLPYWDKGGPKEQKMRAEIREINELYGKVTGE